MVLECVNKLTRDMDAARDAVLERTPAIKAAAPRLGRTSGASISLRSGLRSVGPAHLTTSNGRILATVELPEDGEDASPGASHSS